MSTPKLTEFFRHYRILAISVFLGILVSILGFALNKPLISEGSATAILLILIFGNIIYDAKIDAGCSKCGKWMYNIQIDRIDKQGMLMPDGIDIMKKYKCFYCGHTWTEYSRKARKSP